MDRHAEGEQHLPGGTADWKIRSDGNGVRKFPFLKEITVVGFPLLHKTRHRFVFHEQFTVGGKELGLDLEHEDLRLSVGESEFETPRQPFLLHAAYRLVLVIEKVHGNAQAERIVAAFDAKSLAGAAGKSSDQIERSAAVVMSANASSDLREEANLRFAALD